MSTQYPRDGRKSSDGLTFFKNLFTYKTNKFKYRINNYIILKLPDKVHIIFPLMLLLQRLLWLHKSAPVISFLRINKVCKHSSASWNTSNSTKLNNRGNKQDTGQKMQVNVLFLFCISGQKSDITVYNKRTLYRQSANTFEVSGKQHIQ